MNTFHPLASEPLRGSTVTAPAWQKLPLRCVGLLVAMLTSLAAAPQVLAQAAGTLDALNVSVVGSYVVATAVQPDGKTIIAGSFSSINGVPRSNIARLNADGTLDTGFDPKANTEVDIVVLQADGKILFGGNFTTLQPNGAGNATTRNRIARVNADGTLDTGFDPKANNNVYSAVVEADGKILLGGDFTTLQPNGAASASVRNYIARVNADGTLDTGFDPKANNSIRSVVVQADGKILLGGVFTTLQPNGAVSATTRNRIARVNADGTLDAAFNPSANTDVRSVAVQADGKILLGGAFTTLQPNGAASATTRNRIARVNIDGTLDTVFNPNASEILLNVVVQADGKILFGGAFTTIQPNGAASAATRNRIARVNANGTLDTGFDLNANSAVHSVTVQADGKFLLGGNFSTLQPNGAASATARSRIARLNNDAATQSLSAPDATQVLWQRGGSSPEASQVTFEQSIDSGANWTLLGSGARVGTTSDWQLTGLSLPANGWLRARGRTTGGYQNGSSGLVETIARFPNTLPTASDGIAAATTGDQKTITLPFASTDGDGDTVTLTSTTPDTHLTVNSTSGKDVIFTPAANYAGAATLGYTVSDGWGGSASGTITVTITDNDAPVVAAHVNVTAEATSAAGATVNYAATTATDAVGVTSLTYSQDSGTVFPIGVTTVTITAKDAANNTGTATFTVTVSDTIAPVVATHPNVVVEAVNAAGATVSYTAATVTDAVGATVTYSQDSGTTFPLGVTIVTITAKDAANNTSTKTFTVTVQDTTKPALTLPEAIIAEATSAAGAVVNFSVSASDTVSGALTPGVNLPSGSTFAFGVTTVNVTVADAAGNVTMGSFTVTVRDATAPVIAAHANVTAEATSASGAVVAYSAGSATDAVTSIPAITYSKASGTTFPIGVTTVTITATDAANNQGTRTFTVTVGDTTAPVVTAHANVIAEATSAAGAAVDYAAATATDAVTVSPTITYSKASGTTFPLGVTVVTVTAKDAANNEGMGTFTVTVQDTTAPTISGTFAPLTVFAGTLPEYRNQAVTSDNAGMPDVAQTPERGTPVSVGLVPVSIIARDASGNIATATFTVSVRSPAPTHTKLFANGDPAPHAGFSSLPGGAILTYLNTPATDDAGDVAFVGKWRSIGGEVKGTGLFLNDKCLGIVGGDASAIVAGAKYASFTDPVVEGGKVVCIAKLSTGESAVVSNFTGAALEKIALTGAIAADVGGAKFKSFKAVALRGGSLGFLGQLTGGTGANKVTADNDNAEWVREPGAGLHLVYRDGFDLGNLAFVASFTSFQPGIGSPGQGRGWLSHNQQGLVLSLNTFTDKTKAIVFGGNGGDTFLARTGVVGTNFAPALAGASFASFRYPAMNDALANTFYATMKVGAGGVTKADAGGIFASTADFGGSLAPYALLARTGKPSVVNGANFSTLSDPVLSADGDIAFTATLKGGTAKGLLTKTLWWKPAGQPLALLAQGSAATVGDLPGAQWKSFDSLAITDRGPLFAATLVARKGGVTAATASGVWACDFTGAPRLLFRTGSTVGGKVVKAFTLLKVTVGNAGVTRSFNNVAQVVWLANFADKTIAIITTEVP